MSAGDARVREALRAWRETKSPEAEARFLQARLRVGSLSEHQLSLASYLGHSAARVCESLESEHVQGRITPPNSIYSWVLGLEPWGKKATVRAARVGCLVAVEEWPSLAAEVEPRLGELLRFVELWLTKSRPRRSRKTHGFRYASFENFPWARWLAQELDGDKRSTRFGRNAGSLMASLMHRGVSEALVREKLRATLVSWALGPEHA